jgi:hypothetical protein
MGVGAGWGKGRIGEKESHVHEDHDGDVDVEEALGGMPTLDDSDEEMALFNEDDPVPIRRMSRSNSRSNSIVGISSLSASTPINGNGNANGRSITAPRLLDVLGPADSFVGKNKGVWCDVGFWGGIVPGNKASIQNDLQAEKEGWGWPSFQLQRHLVPLVKAGVKGFKCFLIESGVDVSSEQKPSFIYWYFRVQEFPAVEEEDVRRAMKALNVS